MKTIGEYWRIGDLVGEYHSNTIKANQYAKKEYGRLYNKILFSVLFVLLPTNDTMTMKTLNERSLRKHYDDALSDVDLFNNDMFSLISIQLYLGEDKSKIITKFKKKKKKAKAFFLNIFLSIYQLREKYEDFPADLSRR